MTGDPLLGDLGVPVLSSAACCVPTRGTDDSFLCMCMLLIVAPALLKLYCSCVVFDCNSLMSGASCSTWPTLEVIWEDDEPLRESYTWLTFGWYDKRVKERIFFQWNFIVMYLEHLGEYEAMMRDNEFE